MTNLRHYLYLMFGYLLAVAVVCGFLFIPLQTAFMANWGFNSVILVALLVGTWINIHQVIRLEPELNWISIYRTGEIGLSVVESPRLVRPLAKHLDGLHRDKFSLSALSLSTVLEGIRGRLEESREISRYMIGLLIFLGLLGTFWGLLGTIDAVGKVIGSLEVGAKDFTSVFESMKSGLEMPLMGMGTAFSSSLFGLGGALVLGFLDLQAGHAQNRFFNEMEEWLSGVTQLIDKREKSEPVTAGDRLHGVERNLEMLSQRIAESNRHIEHLVKQNGGKTEDN